MDKKIQKTKRLIVKCEKCSEPKDPCEGRLVTSLKPVARSDGHAILEDIAWYCYECLPPTNEEWDD